MTDILAVSIVVLASLTGCIARRSSSTPQPASNGNQPTPTPATAPNAASTSGLENQASIGQQIIGQHLTGPAVKGSRGGYVIADLTLRADGKYEATVNRGSSSVTLQSGVHVYATWTASGNTLKLDAFGTAITKLVNGRPGVELTVNIGMGDDAPPIPLWVH